jgi:hypothetical protein
VFPGNSKTDINFNTGGNTGCKSDEEMFAKACYKKCSLLDGASEDYPYRTAASTCCKYKGWKCLSPFNVKTNVAFAVSGGKEGDCRAGYEFYAHYCYPKCADLTGGVYSNRVSPTGCCRVTGLKCVLPKYMKVQNNFSSGVYYLKGGNGTTVASAPGAPVDIVDTNVSTPAPEETTGPMDRFR